MFSDLLVLSNVLQPVWCIGRESFVNQVIFCGRRTVKNFRRFYFKKIGKNFYQNQNTLFLVKLTIKNNVELGTKSFVNIFTKIQVIFT